MQCPIYSTTASTRQQQRGALTRKASRTIKSDSMSASPKMQSNAAMQSSWVYRTCATSQATRSYTPDCTAPHNGDCLPSGSKSVRSCKVNNHHAVSLSLSMRAHLERHVTAIFGSEVQLLACLQITLPAQPVKVKSLFGIPFLGPCLTVIQNMLSVPGPVQLLQCRPTVARHPAVAA